jgi:dynein heavy chain 1
MITKYINNPDYDFEKVNRASLACGPLVKWATAQVITITFINFVFYF